ncbi:hypothetical protein GDO81_000321 [Engystomops pustulosus]|uniref:Uncharacterized protein n=1 Tax=Engystomops pustulosus TaxID=76066 RepID=A0AAV7D5A9_ENGPU|nr:hypothetical protein GDO81_000321 [Engystomops pustulosus]
MVVTLSLHHKQADVNKSDDYLMSHLGRAIFMYLGHIMLSDVYVYSIRIIKSTTKENTTTVIFCSIYLFWVRYPNQKRFLFSL